MIGPLLDHCASRLREGVLKISRGLEKPPFDPSTVEDQFFSNLTRRLQWMLRPTLVLELNVARINGLLYGDTAETRFRNFIERLSHNETALAILQEYPVLARQLVVCGDQWLAYTLEFLAHLSTDFSVLGAAFAPGSDIGMLTDVSSVGDRHRNGRSVLIAEFSSSLKLAYQAEVFISRRSLQ